MRNVSISAGGDIWRGCFVLVIVSLSFFMIQHFGSVADCDFGLFFKSSGPLTTEGNKTDTK